MVRRMLCVIRGMLRFSLGSFFCSSVDHLVAGQKVSFASFPPCPWMSYRYLTALSLSLWLSPSELLGIGMPSLNMLLCVFLLLL